MDSNDQDVLILVLSALPFAMTFGAAEYSGNWQQFWVVLPWFMFIGAAIGALVILTGAAVWLFERFQERRMRKKG